MARELQGSVGQFEDVKELLEQVLPRLGEPDHADNFHQAAERLTDRLDEMAVHQLSMLLSELWLYRNSPAPRRSSVDGTSAQAGSVTDTERGTLPAVMEIAVNLAGYLGAAAIGGVIGNRTDAQVQRLVHEVHQRWRARRPGPHDPLARDEAVEVAAAAATTQDFDDLELVSAHLRSDTGSWEVRLRSGDDTLTVGVPPGDPSRARIVIRVS
jgi:hypothetical protein